MYIYSEDSISVLLHSKHCNINNNNNNNNNKKIIIIMVVVFCFSFHI